MKPKVKAVDKQFEDLKQFENNIQVYPILKAVNACAMCVCFSIEPQSKSSNVYMHTFSPVQSARPRAFELSQRVLIWSVVSLMFRKKNLPKKWPAATKASRRRGTPAQWRQSETGSE